MSEAAPQPGEFPPLDDSLLTPFEKAVIARLDRIIELLAPRPAESASPQEPKPRVDIVKTHAMGKTHVRETNLDTGVVRNYVE